jgi:iron complex outermembrane receptor protein
MSVRVRTIRRTIAQRTASILRGAPIPLLFSCMIGGNSAAAAEVADKSAQISLPAGALAEALDRRGDQPGVQVAYEPALAKGIDISAVSGTLTGGAALQQLLVRTGLNADRVDEKTATLKRAGANEEPVKKEHDKSTLNRTHHEFTGGLEEIVVTAQKKEERLQDVPLPVTSIDAQTLVDDHQLSIQDYYTRVPGLGLTTAGQGNAKISIRGMTSSSFVGTPTVGVVVDDAPYGSSTASGASRPGAPDIDPSDLARIEVLRGPQGTLYGASSIGGLIKFVTVDPSTAGFSGQIETDGSGTRHGEGLGGAVRGAVNIPLADSLAIRASSFVRHDPGYLDVPLYNLQGVNKVDAYGGRFAALLKLGDRWSVKLSGLSQTIRSSGSDDGTLQPGINPLDQLLTVRGAGAYTNRNQSYVGTVTGLMGPATLTSITSYNIVQSQSSIDTTNAFGTLPDVLSGVHGSAQYDVDETDKFTQEVRLSGSFLEHFEWLAGLYYTHEDDSKDGSINYVADPPTGAVAAIILGDAFPTTFAERAAFADLTVHFTSQFDVQLGGRKSENRQSYKEIFSGPALSATQPLVHTTDNSFTYLVTPRYRWSDDLMAYVRVASGYRPGGPNWTCTLFPAPCAYKADTSVNYELGFKFSSPDRRVSLDASVYYINWNAIQIVVTNSISPYFANAGKAKSQGVELSGQWRAAEGLTLAAWVSWNDAVLKEGFPANSGAVGVSGDRLPYAARFSGNISIEESMPVGQGLTATFGAVGSYIGSRATDFAFIGGAPREPDLPGYTKLDLHADLRWGLWTAGLFADNLTDQRGVLYVYNRYYTTPNNEGAMFIRPRTLGLSLTRTF